MWQWGRLHVEMRNKATFEHWFEEGGEWVREETSERREF